MAICLLMRGDEVEKVQMFCNFVYTQKIAKIRSW